MDLLVSVVNATSMTSFHVDATVYCPPDYPTHTSPQQYSRCMNNDPPTLSITNGRALYDNGSIINIADRLTPALNQSTYNFLYGLLAASQADMGIWQNNTFFVNATMLNVTISPADAVSAAVVANPDLKAYYDQSDWFIVPAAQTIRTQSFSQYYFIPDAMPNQLGPLPFPASEQSPQSIATTYVCHIQQLKSPFSLIISIIVADASEFTTLWGVVMLIAVYLARRRERSTYNAVDRDSWLKDGRHY